MLVDLAREKFDEATVEPLVDVVLLGLPYRCWRCGDVSTPIVGMAEPGADVHSEELVVCDDEEELALAWQHLPAEARERWRVGEVRRRHSRTAGTAYLSNGCASCGALLWRLSPPRGARRGARHRGGGRARRARRRLDARLHVDRGLRVEVVVTTNAPGGSGYVGGRTCRPPTTLSNGTRRRIRDLRSEGSSGHS